MKTGFTHETLNNITETRYYENDKLIKTYRYPDILRRFSSPMISYDNLNLSGINSYSLDEMNRVINELKPMSESKFKVDNNNCKCCKKCKKAVNKIMSSIDLTKFAARINLCEYENHVHSLKIATDKTFNKLFDMYNFIQDYLTFMDASTELSKIDESGDFREFEEDEKDAFKYVMKDIVDKKVSGYIDTVNITNPTKESELIFSGLLQGHPIETTFALLTSNYLHPERK